jgi:hypothetical protein
LKTTKAGRFAPVRRLDEVPELLAQLCRTAGASPMLR